ncbi:MAG: hypothetical protein ACYDHH_34300, partial [Solirubrobacteraceae bacterium]
MPQKHRERPTKRVNPSGEVVWMARYTGPDGKRRKAGTFKLKRDAQDAIDDAYKTPRSRDTVGSYAADWSRRYPRSEQTDRTNNQRLAAVLDVEIEGRALGSWPLTALRRRHAIELLDCMLREQGRAISGARGILSVLSAMV